MFIIHNSQFIIHNGGENSTSAVFPELIRSLHCAYGFGRDDTGAKAQVGGRREEGQDSLVLMPVVLVWPRGRTLNCIMHNA